MKAHNSRFKMFKSILVDFSRSKHVEWPNMTLQGTVISPKASHKFLGVMLNQDLLWHQQADYAIGKASKWIMAYRRLARVATGVNLWLMRQLYMAVTIPKMMYTIEVWLTPLQQQDGAKKCTGSVGMVNRLASLQRVAALAITGAMHTTATDVIDLHADLLPMRLATHRLCQQATLRIASLPETHLLHDVSHRQARRYIKSH